MKRILTCLVAISLMSIGGSVWADEGSGIVLDDGGVQASVVTLSVPPQASRGDIVNVGVNYPAVNPTNVRCFLVMPTNDPATYVQEMKAYTRVVNFGSTGVSCPFYIPTFFQIEGLAIAIAVVQGQGFGFAFFPIVP